MCGGRGCYMGNLSLVLIFAVNLNTVALKSLI